MKKYTQKKLKTFVETGAAVNVTYWDSEQLYTLARNDLDHIAYSTGVNGANGLLIQDTKTGKLYAVIGRSTALFILL